jgi:predicted RNA polymerase sigma factor
LFRGVKNHAPSRRFQLSPFTERAGDFVAKLGRCDEARVNFERAASLARSAREAQLLLDRAAACADSSR